MSNLLPISHGLAPREAVTVPLLTPDLKYAVGRALDPSVGVDLGGFTDRNRTEAEQVLPLYEALCRPAGPAMVYEWLTDVALSVRNPPSEEDFEQRVRLVTEACEKLPALAWSPETRRAAMREWKFWPAVADVSDFLKQQPEVAKLLRTRDALRTIATSTPAKPPAPEASAAPDPEQREQILAKFHADLRRAKAEVDTARDSAPARAPLRDVCLKGEALAESRRRRGIVPKDPAKTG